MALELRQQLKLAQQLVMTPQLQQAIKLLQLSRMELLETVQQEMLDNPFLEESQGDDGSAEPAEDRREKATEEVYDQDLAKDADWEDYLGEFASTPRLVQPREFEVAEDISPLEARYSAKPTLEGHLLWQLRLSSLSDAQKDIGEVIIGNLSSAGYLHASIDEIAQMTESDPSDVLTVLEKVQLFDPVGVAARDARECLLVQIKSLKYDRDPILLELIRSHLEDLEGKRYKPLLRKFKLDMEELKEYLDIIQSLDPLPGASFGGGEPTYVSPDVFVYKMGDEFVILLNEDGLPQLQLSNMNQMDMKGASDKEKEYCTEKMRSASWLIKSLYQRQRTLYKVMESIVRHQQAFFEVGVSRLAPLILKDIADDISMHESTVSRITTNKYVATPHGIFELKFFFNSGLELDDGSQVGSESVKALIKKFIADEDTKSPLSDERIGEMLKDHLKVNIARRTVAKYRTALDIPSSSRRKEHF
ncbi:RNA polymerase factor sigma-54 [Desulfovibrio intestinalis]|uniref:RNA polymerase sigma-54 factor n=1 Tax=Desulfovibrio intestinalis TaxID=58621 RepID=A0A7W8C3G9_9BACT|nr:RNA polymerase factor sigma-54 [Desulfovibrio intestinalis]MBB5143757.1 RNA polymerase sigma-54 factor [Desulfovibrio intestinalis]